MEKHFSYYASYEINLQINKKFTKSRDPIPLMRHVLLVIRKNEVAYPIESWYRVPGTVGTATVSFLHFLCQLTWAWRLLRIKHYVPNRQCCEKLEAKMLRKLKGETKIWRKSRDAKEWKISQEFISQLSALKLIKIVTHWKHPGSTSSSTNGETDLELRRVPTSGAWYTTPATM